MADTNLLVLAREYKKLREEVKKVLSMPKGDKGDRGEKGEKGDKGDTGPQGFPGRDGKDGVNGFDGKDGRDGIDGKDGKDGLDGVGVQNAYIDFDNSLVIVLTDGTEVNAGFLSQETKDNIVATFKQGAQTLNELLPTQTGNSGKFLKTDGTDVSWDTLDGSDINLSSPPVIGNTTPNAATFTTLRSTDQADLGGISGQESLRVISVGSATTPMRVTGTSASAGGFWSTGSISFACGTTQMSFRSAASTSSPSAGPEQMRVSHTASAVNYVQVTGGATGAGPIISVQGSDSNAEFKYRTKGIFNHVFENGSGAANFIVNQTAGSSVVNRLSVAGSLTNQEPVMSAVGSDTNISMAFQSKGTGGISLSTGSQGTSLVNGTTVTAITRTNAGGNYTSPPSVTISPPTTAGGVQATASVDCGPGGQTIASGGTGYTLNDIVTVSGGTFTTPYRLTVTGVSGGVITSVSAQQFGSYTVFPANPVSVTGGTGTGATFNLNWSINIPTITNAGSGYVEQPTVTFSGGGGSGAAAYATVGSGTTVRSLGSTMSFTTAGGEQVRVLNTNAANYMTLSGSGTGSAISLGPAGTDGGIATQIFSKGSGTVEFWTNGGNQRQMIVSHTASAVNYVQVTGAATGIGPVISAQGSDTNVRLRFASKNAEGIQFEAGGVRQFYVGPLTNAVNFIQAVGATAGSAPTFSVLGSDTNIGLNLTTKGTGAVTFTMNTGTLTASYDTAGNQTFVSGTGNVNWSSTAGGSQRFFTRGTSAQQFQVADAASAVNYVQVTGGATGVAPTISSQGSDTNVDMFVASKGSAWIYFRTAGSTTQAIVRHTASAVNRLTFTGSTAGNAPTIGLDGSDTNIDLALTPKGTGLVRFGTYTANMALTVQGYIEIKDSGGTTRRLAVIG